MAERKMPCNKDAEKSLLGCLLQSAEARAKLSGVLAEDDFYFRPHIAIFRAIKNVEDAGSVVDVVTVCVELRKLGLLKAAGGAEYVTATEWAAPSPSGGPYYADIVKEAAAQRRLMAIAGAILDGVGEKLAAADIAELAESDIAGAMDHRLAGKEQDMAPEAVMDAFEGQYAKPIETIPTPFAWVNDMIGGLIPGNLITIAGRTSAGKSAMALQIAKSAAKTCLVLYISLEMSQTELVGRYIASETGIPMRAITMHRVRTEDMDTMDAAKTRFRNSRLCLTSRGKDLVSLVRLIRMCRPSVAVVDCVNLVRAEGESERVKILNITRELKQLALDIDIPVIILAQLSRGSDEKVAPTLRDIKESASIEEDSDVVLLLAEIDSGKTLKKLQEQGVDLGVEPDEFSRMRRYGSRLVFGLIQKNRSGPLGRGSFWFEGRKFTFTEVGAAERHEQMEMLDEENKLPF